MISLEVEIGGDQKHRRIEGERDIRVAVVWPAAA
jgi:hypothetical protein